MRCKGPARAIDQVAMHADMRRFAGFQRMFLVIQALSLVGDGGFCWGAEPSFEFFTCLLPFCSLLFLGSPPLRMLCGRQIDMKLSMLMRSIDGTNKAAEEEAPPLCGFTCGYRGLF